MVLIWDSRSELVAQGWRKFRHFKEQKIKSNFDTAFGVNKFPEQIKLPGSIHTCATCSEQPSNISRMLLVLMWNIDMQSIFAILQDSVLMIWFILNRIRNQSSRKEERVKFSLELKPKVYETIGKCYLIEIFILCKK